MHVEGQKSEATLYCSLSVDQIYVPNFATTMLVSFCTWNHNLCEHILRKITFAFVFQRI